MGSRIRWVVASLLIATACGGGGADEGTGQAESTPQAAAEALVDRWRDDRGAFYVAAWSLDAGYSAGQIIGAAPHDRIQADGAIADAGGALLEPANAAAGLLTAIEGEALGPGAVLAVAGPARPAAMRFLADAEPQDARVAGMGWLSEIHSGAPNAFENRMAQLREDPLTPWEHLALEQTELITRVTLELGARGYSGRQILDAIFRGNWVRFLTEDPPGGCWYVLAGKGGYGAAFVEPEYAPVDPIHELECAHAVEEIEEEWVAPTTTTAEPDDEPTEAPVEGPTDQPADEPSEEPADEVAAALTFPRTYDGGGPVTWSLSWAQGSCVVEGNTLELTLQADGTLNGTYRRTDPTFSGTSAPGASQQTVECGEQVFVQDPVEVSGSHTPPSPGADDTGAVAVEIAGWPDWHIEGEYTADEMKFVWTIELEATGYQGDEANPQIFRVVDFTLSFTGEGI